MFRRPAAAPSVLRRPAASSSVHDPRRGLTVPAPSSPSLQSEPTGPREQGNTREGRARRQYCWWITFAFPYVETVQRLGLSTPSDLAVDGKGGRQKFLEIVRAAHEAVHIDVLECAVFLERHLRTDSSGNRLPHLNCLVKSSSQYSWISVAKELFDSHKIRVDFASNIHNWYDGIVYGHVFSDHKPLEELDATPLQWERNGCPTPFSEVLPAKWHRDGRQPKLSMLQVYDLFTANHVLDERGAWALANRMAKEGKRGLLAALLEHRDVTSRVQGLGKCRSDKKLYVPIPRTVASSCQADAPKKQC